jgi:hypothetical protein
MEKLDGNDTRNSNSDKTAGCNSDKSKVTLTAAQALVILGIVTNSLDINSILVGRQQNIEILLVGSLKQKTELQKTIEGIGKLPFADVLKAVMGNL